MSNTNDLPNYEKINSEYEYTDSSKKLSPNLINLILIHNRPDSKNEGTESNKQTLNVTINIKPEQIKLVQPKIYLIESKKKEINFLKRKTRKQSDDFFEEITKIENDLRKINLNDDNNLKNSLPTYSNMEKDIDKGFGNEYFNFISTRDAMKVFLDEIQFFIENIGVIKLIPVDLDNIFKEIKSTKKLVKLVIKEIFCFNKENKRIIEEAIPLNEVLFNYALETEYEFLFYKYFINCKIFIINEKKEVIQDFKTINDIVEKMESEYFHYEWDYKEEKINKFIYSSFLVFNKFKKNKDKNPNKFNFIDYCPKCVKNRISYLMNKPYEYLEGLYISSREEKDPNKKIDYERIKYYLKLKKIIDLFENSSDMEIDDEKEKEIKNFKYLGNNFEVGGIELEK